MNVKRKLIRPETVLESEAWSERNQECCKNSVRIVEKTKSENWGRKDTMTAVLPSLHQAHVNCQRNQRGWENQEIYHSVDLWHNGCTRLLMFSPSHLSPGKQRSGLPPWHHQTRYHQLKKLSWRWFQYVSVSHNIFSNLSFFYICSNSYRTQVQS